MCWEREEMCCIVLNESEDGEMVRKKERERM